jgi:hypothetical protein
MRRIATSEPMAPTREGLMKGTFRRVAVATASLLLLWTLPALADAAPRTLDAPDTQLRNAIELSPIAPLLRIYEAQYARRLGAQDELLLGLAYTNIKYDHGQSHAPTVIVGYRRALWKGVHLEYQIWSSYNRYLEFDEQRWYEGAELWNEIRPCYTFDFHLGRAPLFLNLQYLIGFALYGGNKPQSFKDQAKREGVFTAPMFFLGWRY